MLWPSLNAGVTWFTLSVAQHKGLVSSCSLDCHGHSFLLLSMSACLSWLVPLVNFNQQQYSGFILHVPSCAAINFDVILWLFAFISCQISSSVCDRWWLWPDTFVVNNCYLSDFVWHLLWITVTCLTLYCVCVRAWVHVVWKGILGGVWATVCVWVVLLQGSR